MNNFEDLCIGVVCGDGYYRLGTQEKILTDKVRNIPSGTFIKPDFTPLLRQEIADYFGITVEEWINLFCS